MVTYRPIVAPDATTIARIHATSWRSAYRGILPGGYLDDDIDADRLSHWRRRLSKPTERDVGVLALQDGAPVGFGFAFATTMSAGARCSTTCTSFPSTRDMVLAAA